MTIRMPDRQGNFLVRRKSRNSAAVSRRRTFFEMLEPRYALTAPVAGLDFFTIGKDTALVSESPGVLANDSDVDGDPLTVVAVNGSADNVGIPQPLPEGTLTIFGNGKITFLPQAGFDGVVDFSYRVGDTHNETGFGVGQIRVVPIAIQQSEYFISEGQDGTFDEESQLETGLWLHNDGSVGTDLDYFWRIDPAPVDPLIMEAQSLFVPGTQGPVLEGPDHPVSWSQLNAWGITNATDTAVVTLKVVDAAGKASYAQSPLVVGDIDPVITSFTVEQSAGGGCGETTFLMNATFEDPNAFDVFDVSIDWDLNGNTFEVVEHEDGLTYTNNNDGTFTVTASHTYSETEWLSGWRLPRLIVSGINEGDDDSFIDNGVSPPEFPGTPLFVEAGGGAAGPQTVCLDAGVLMINGGTGGDAVTISAVAGNVQIDTNFPEPTHAFAAGLVNQIVVKLGDGNDILINSTTKAMVAVGGAGTDIITDAGGRGILIGGAGSDILSGGGGQDILIDSSTDYDADDQALLALLAYWNNTSLSLSTRVNNLLVGNGVPALNGDTILGDGAFDLLVGGGSTDWVLLHSEDFSLGLGDILDDVDDL